MSKWSKIISNIFRRHDLVSVDKIRKSIIQDTHKYCYDFGGPLYEWPRPNQLSKDCDYIKNIYIKYKGIQVGYVQGISISRKYRNVQISHFAIEHEFIGFGFGNYIARYFARKVSRLYNIKTITFAENHVNYEERDYEKFFISLGAKKVKGTRSRWIWDVENYRI